MATSITPESESGFVHPEDVGALLTRLGIEMPSGAPLPFQHKFSPSDPREAERAARRQTHVAIFRLDPLGTYQHEGKLELRHRYSVTVEQL